MVDGRPSCTGCLEEGKTGVAGNEGHEKENQTTKKRICRFWAEADDIKIMPIPLDSRDMGIITGTLEIGQLGQLGLSLESLRKSRPAGRGLCSGGLRRGMTHSGILGALGRLQQCLCSVAGALGLCVAQEN